MPTDRPEIFVSATSGDLRSCRQVIKEALLTLGCVPIEQTNFPPDAQTVRQMLQSRIAACHAVVHLAGEVYGAEPQQRNPDEPRRSYTQLEYEIARELGKRVYVFICGEGFPYDEHPPEDDVRRTLQQEHRARLTASDHLYTPVTSRDELAVRIHALQDRIKLVEQSLRRSRSWLVRGVAVGLVLAVLLGGGLWALNQRTSKQEERISQVETELDRQRRTIKAVADAYTQQQAQLADLKLTDAELFERAVSTVAQREGVATKELEAGINLFVAAIRNDPSADFLDRALADFAEQKFAAASENAGLAADQARTQRLAAEKLAAQATEQAHAATVRERTARNLQGQSLYAERRYGEAVDAFTAAIAITPRAEEPATWADLQGRLGLAYADWASNSTGPEIAARRVASLAAYRAALEVQTRDAMPVEWATNQNALGNTLRSQALAADGAQRAELLAESAAAFRKALEVRTRADHPAEWAETMTNLASVIGDQALTVDSADRGKLLSEAVADLREALEVQNRADFPQDWSLTQNNLGLAIFRQTEFVDPAEQSRLLNEAAAAFRAALEVRTRANLPQDWATTQSNLASVLGAQAMLGNRDDRKRIFDETIAVYRSVLEVRTRAEQPQTWAMTQVNLANALQKQSFYVDVADNMRVRAEAIAAYRAALEVFTRDTLPQFWAATQRNLGSALEVQGSLSDEPEKSKLLNEAVAAVRASLEVYTREAMPQDWAMTHNNLATLLKTQAESASGPDAEKLLEEAVAEMRLMLEVFDERIAPRTFAQRSKWIEEVEKQLYELRITNENKANKTGGFGPPPRLP